MAKKSTRPPKRILYIITKSVWGGAAKYVYDLATNLRPENFEVFIAAGGQGKFAQRIKEAKLPYFEIKNFQKKVSILKDFLAGFEILDLLFKLRPDIIHVNSSKAGGVAGLAGSVYKILNTKYKIQVIFTAHGWAFAEDKQKWQIFLIKFFSKLTCLFYDKIICVSEYDRQIALKNKIAPARKLITIHNGIDIKAISFLPKEKAKEKLLTTYRLPLTASIVIGTIAEWTKNKGLFYLLEAIRGQSPQQRGLSPESPGYEEFDAVLIGSGENIDKVKMYDFIKKHNLENIHLIEWIDNAASYLKAFDIFILPSIKEGLPYTILEAMAAEVPIIATNVGGVPEMLKGDNPHFVGTVPLGILIPSKNSQRLALKILYLINNPEIGREMARQARKKAEKEFSLEEMIEKTKNLYV